MNATVVLTPPMSKRLIAAGVAQLPSVRHALSNGRVLVTLGTTNAAVAETLLGKGIDREGFAAGFIDDRWNVNSRVGEVAEVYLVHGSPVEASPDEILNTLAASDVLVKGGNALDPWGVVGVLLASASGGTVGRYVPTALARGVEIVIPISLSKATHESITDLAACMGIGRTKHKMGLACGIYPLHGHVVTELEALSILYDIEASHVASGGLGCGAGSVSLLLRGDAAAVGQAFSFIESLGEAADVSLRGRA